MRAARDAEMRELDKEAGVNYGENEDLLSRGYLPRASYKDTLAIFSIAMIFFALISSSFVAPFNSSFAHFN
jgi:hypothetical protein